MLIWTNIGLFRILNFNIILHATIEYFNSFPFRFLLDCKNHIFWFKFTINVFAQHLKMKKSKTNFKLKCASLHLYPLNYTRFFTSHVNIIKNICKLVIQLFDKHVLSVDIHRFKCTCFSL